MQQLAASLLASPIQALSRRDILRGCQEMLYMHCLYWRMRNLQLPQQAQDCWLPQPWASQRGQVQSGAGLLQYQQLAQPLAGWTQGLESASKASLAKGLVEEILWTGKSIARDCFCCAH